MTVSSASETESSDDEPSLAPKTLVKRNVAWWAKSGRRKFFMNPAAKRNVAWLARIGGRDTEMFPSSPKRLMNDEEEIEYSPIDNEETVDYSEIYEPYIMEKRNIASLVNSRTIPSFIVDNKRHVGSAMRYRGNNEGNYDFVDRPNKRYFASLLKSETPPSVLYPRMQRRYSYFPENEVSKRFFSSLLENADSAPGEDMDEEKRGGFASLLKSDTPYKNGKRSFASLLKSDSGIGMSGKRYYSSLLDDADTKDKRFVASLLKSRALQGISQGPSNRLLESIYDRQGNEMEKRNFASLINRQNPYSNSRHITKRHVGSLRDPSKRFYGSLLDEAKDDDEKRSFGAILKSSNYQRPLKKNIGAALRYRQGKRDPGDDAPTEEELQLDALQRKFLESMLDATAQDKRHFSSLLDNRDTRSNVFYNENAYPLEDVADKRHFASLLDNQNKRFLGSLLDAKDRCENGYLCSGINSRTDYKNDDKRFLGSAINSRTNFKTENDKRFLGSTINSRMNYINDDKRFLGSTLRSKPDGGMDKRFVGSIVQSRDDLQRLNEQKRFFASILDNTRKNEDDATGNMDKRFLGSTLKSKSPGTDDIRSKRDVVDLDLDSTDQDHEDNSLVRNKRSADYYTGEDGDEYSSSQVKRFLRKYNFCVN